MKVDSIGKIEKRCHYTLPLNIDEKGIVTINLFDFLMGGKL